MNLINFSQIMSSRLCHDLISPAGAVSSGVELLEGEISSSLEVFELVKRSSLNLNNRLVFYRAAWGALSSNAQSMPDLFDMIRNYCHTYNVQLVVNEAHVVSFLNDNQSVLPNYAKVLLCGVSLIKDILPQGGTFHLQLIEHSGVKSLGFVFEGRLYKLKDDMTQILTGDFDESYVTTKTIHCLLLRLYASEANLLLNIDALNDTRLVVMAIKQNSTE